MVSPIFANVSANLTGNSVGDGRVFSTLNQNTFASPNATGGSSFANAMGFNWKNNPWQASAPGSDTSHTLDQSASVTNDSNSTLPWGASMTKNIGGQVSASGKYFDFSGSWGAVGAFGLGNFNDASTAQHMVST